MGRSREGCVKCTGKGDEMDCVVWSASNTQPLSQLVCVCVCVSLSLSLSLQATVWVGELTTTCFLTHSWVDVRKLR